MASLSYMMMKSSGMDERATLNEVLPQKPNINVSKSNTKADEPGGAADPHPSVPRPAAQSRSNTSSPMPGRPPRIPPSSKRSLPNSLSDSQSHHSQAVLADIGVAIPASAPTKDKDGAGSGTVDHLHHMATSTMHDLLQQSTTLWSQLVDSSTTTYATATMRSFTSSQDESDNRQGCECSTDPADDVDGTTDGEDDQSIPDLNRSLSNVSSASATTNILLRKPCDEIDVALQTALSEVLTIGDSEGEPLIGQTDHIGTDDDDDDDDPHSIHHVIVNQRHQFYEPETSVAGILHGYNQEVNADDVVAEEEDPGPLHDIQRIFQNKDVLIRKQSGRQPHGSHGRRSTESTAETSLSGATPMHDSESVVSDVTLPWEVLRSGITRRLEAPLPPSSLSSGDPFRSRDTSTDGDKNLDAAGFLSSVHVTGSNAFTSETFHDSSEKIALPHHLLCDNASSQNDDKWYRNGAHSQPQNRPPLSTIDRSTDEVDDQSSVSCSCPSQPAQPPPPPALCPSPPRHSLSPAPSRLSSRRKSMTPMRPPLPPKRIMVPAVTPDASTKSSSRQRAPPPPHRVGVNEVSIDATENGIEILPPDLSEVTLSPTPPPRAAVIVSHRVIVTPAVRRSNNIDDSASANGMELQYCSSASSSDEEDDLESDCGSSVGSVSLNRAHTGSNSSHVTAPKTLRVRHFGLTVRYCVPNVESGDELVSRRGLYSGPICSESRLPHGNGVVWFVSHGDEKPSAANYSSRDDLYLGQWVHGELHGLGALSLVLPSDHPEARAYRRNRASRKPTTTVLYKGRFVRNRFMGSGS